MMILNKNEVLLLKSPSEDEDKFASMLTKNGFKVKYLQILEFVFLNLPLLQKELENIEAYNGIIFTSPRAIAATKLSLNNGLIDDRWHSKNNFVVGETTFLLASNKLGLFCEGKESGNANNLADIIIKGNYNKPFLFPCGNLKKETLQIRLKENNIDINPITVYETKKKENLVEEFCKLTEDFTNTPEYILFFSPSGVHFTADIFRNFPLNQIKMVAIGPSTKKALEIENLPVYSTATKPIDIEVLNAIQNNTQ